MSQQLRNILKGYFTTGAKPTQAQFENLIDSLFSLLDDKKSAITGLERAINIRGAGDLYNASFRGGMTDRLKGDAWIMSGVASPVEGDNAALKAGDIIVAWKDDAAMADFAIDTEWYILRIGTLLFNKADNSTLAEFAYFPSFPQGPGELLVSAGSESNEIESSLRSINDLSSPSATIIWTSSKINSFAGDGTVNYARLHSTLTSRVNVSTLNLDWSTGAIFTKELSVDSTITFTNLQINKTITFIVSGNVAVTLPGVCRKLSGTYSRSATNYIQFHCTNSSEVWYTISQEVV
jgi:hypothetical protein